MIGKFVVVMIVAGGAFCACTQEKKQDDVLDKDEMTSLLIEVYLAEARVGTSIFIADSARHVFEAHEKVLLQRRGLTDSAVKRSYEYYLEHPVQMQEIMDAVIDSLSLREQTVGLTPPYDLSEGR